MTYPPQQRKNPLKRTGRQAFRVPGRAGFSSGASGLEVPARASWRNPGNRPKKERLSRLLANFVEEQKAPQKKQTKSHSAGPIPSPVLQSKARTKLPRPGELNQSPPKSPKSPEPQAREGGGKTAANFGRRDKSPKPGLPELLVVHVLCRGRGRNFSVGSGTLGFGAEG